MAGSKKKRNEGSSVSHNDDPLSHILDSLQTLTTEVQNLKYEHANLKSEHEQKFKKLKSEHANLKSEHANQASTIQAHEQKFKKLKPIQTKYVRDRGLYLVNEFVSFIDQIHRTSVQRKFDKNYNTGKFQKLTSSRKFTADCANFLQSERDLAEKSALNIVQMFNTLCNLRNRAAHFESPEDCLEDIFKLKKKHSDMLHKRDEGVSYCLLRIWGIATHFIGSYRLQRLTCEFLASFLKAHGQSREKTLQIGNVLIQNQEVITKFIPEGMTFKLWKSQVIDLFKASQAYGPTFRKGSKDVGVNYSSIQKSFQKCLRLEMLSKREFHTLEYFVLESSVD